MSESNLELLTTDEVAGLLRTPTETLRAWRRHGKGPTAFRVGRRILYSRHDVLGWLESQRLIDEATRHGA